MTSTVVWETPGYPHALPVLKLSTLGVEGTGGVFGRFLHPQDLLTYLLTLVNACAKAFCETPREYLGGNHQKPENVDFRATTATNQWLDKFWTMDKKTVH